MQLLKITHVVVDQLLKVLQSLSCFELMAVGYNGCITNHLYKLFFYRVREVCAEELLLVSEQDVRLLQPAGWR